MSLSLAAKTGVARALEGPQAMRLQVVPPPDALHRAQREPHRLGHCTAGPMGRLMRWCGAGQRHQLGRFIGRDRRFAGLAGLVAQQTLHAGFGEALLPAPHGRPADADALSNPLRRSPIGGGEHDARPLHVFLPPVAVGHDRLQSFPVHRADDHTYSLSHVPSIAHSPAGESTE